jgi:glycosyltransferase involved in cell wall biosynthesis
LDNSIIAVIIPCYNEELTIAEVIKQFGVHLPSAQIYVFDNNSTDKTAEIALALGAKVMKEKRQGKGFVVQAMFQKIDADIYVMVDGDATYDLSKLNEMIATIINDQADMIVGNRLKTYTSNSFRPLHTFGNKLVRLLINKLFRSDLKDIMSGMRVMNKQFVKNINISSSGFEVETEMTIKALKNGFVLKEVDIQYKERPPGSFSKLNTFKDGFLVIRTIFMIFKDFKPLLFFLCTSLFLAVCALLAGSIVIDEFIKTRYITHVPLAILASGTIVLSVVFFTTGIILDAVNRRIDELFHFIKNKE